VEYEYMINSHGKYVVPWAKSADFWEYLLAKNDVKVIKMECNDE
jgi:hypothetical protein